MHVYDVIVVGAGPIGIELAAALKRAGLDYAHLEAGSIGQTLTWWAPQTRFFSSPERIQIAGVPLVGVAQEKATGEEYLTYLRGVVTQLDLEIHQNERVTGIERAGEGESRVFTLRSEGRAGAREWQSRRLVLAIGDMHKARKIGVPGEDLPHVSHYFQDPHLYFRQRTVIVGGKNSAVEAAIRCFRVGAKVTLAHRGDDIGARVKYWLRPEFEAPVRTGQIEFLKNVTPVRIEPQSVVFESANEDGSASGAGRVEVPADFVLLMTGYEQDPALFEMAGVELHNIQRKPRFEKLTMQTNVPGLYVAGTATAGTQIGGTKVFIETAHVHVRRIMASLTGREASLEELEDPEYVIPEA